MLIKLLYSCFVSFFDLYKEYNNCLILFLSFSELFPAFNWAKIIGNLLSIWFGVSIFKPKPCCFRFSLLKIRISSTIYNILSGFSVSFSSSDIFSISSFKLLHLILINSTKSLFFFLSFVSYNFFTKALGTLKLKYSLNKL